MTVCACEGRGLYPPGTAKMLSKTSYLALWLKVSPLTLRHLFGES